METFPRIFDIFETNVFSNKLRSNCDTSEMNTRFIKSEMCED